MARLMMFEEIMIKQEPVMEVDSDEGVKNEWLPPEDLEKDLEDAESWAPSDPVKALEYEVKQENLEPTCDVTVDPNVEISFVDNNIGPSQDEVLNLSSNQHESDPLSCTSAKTTEAPVLTLGLAKGSNAPPPLSICNANMKRGDSTNLVLLHSSLNDKSSSIQNSVPNKIFNQQHSEYESNCSVNTQSTSHMTQMASVGIANSYECEICDVNFTDRDQYVNHLKMNIGVEKLKCEFCERCFTRSSDLRIHLTIHSPVNDYKCEVCGKCFIRKGNLQTHLKYHSGIKDYKCEVCGKCFTQNCDLQKHLKVHSGVRDFKCEMCGKCFTQSNSLKTHLKIHSGIRDFKCLSCEKCFTQNSDLQKHLKVHSGVKDFKCEVCAKCFTRRSILVKHLKIHSSGKTYKCEICGQCFTRSYELQKHFKIHSDVKNHKCDICGKCFAVSRYLRSHLKIHALRKDSKR